MELDARSWPHFIYGHAPLEPLESRFLLSSGEVIGAVRHVCDEERDLLRIELVSDEAVKTSEIEGEMIDRLSVQSSLRRPLRPTRNVHASCAAFGD